MNIAIARCCEVPLPRNRGGRVRMPNNCSRPCRSRLRSALEPHLLQAGLLQNTVQCCGRQIVTRLPGYGHAARLWCIFELPGAAAAAGLYTRDAANHWRQTTRLIIFLRSEITLATVFTGISMAEVAAEYLRPCRDQNVCPACQRAIVHKCGSGQFKDGVFCSLNCYTQWNAAEIARRIAYASRNGESGE